MNYLYHFIIPTVFIFLPLTEILSFTAFKWCILLIGREKFYVGKEIKRSKSFSDERCFSNLSFSDSYAAIKYRLPKIAFQTIAKPFPVW